MVQDQMIKFNVKIAAITDHFGSISLKHECNLVKLEFAYWKDILVKQKPDILLAESIWGNVYKQLMNHAEKRTAGVENIYDWCKKQGIPTVFWCKEDPISFLTFVKVAKNFDYIFTTDLNSIPKYKEICGHDNVYVLPHAAQLKVHNPINKDQEKWNHVGFAGTWYAHCRPERQNDMRLLFNPSIKYGLDIYDRNLNLRTQSYRFPKEYKPYLKRPVPYEKTGEVYKKYNIFLNVNTVRESPTMHSMRVFEVLACGINLLSGYSKSMDEMVSEIVKICRTEKDTEKYLNMLLHNSDLRDRLSLLGQRTVFNQHTYTHRIATILEKTGFSDRLKPTPGVSIIAYLDSPDQFAQILDNYQRQNYAKKELLIIINYADKNLKEKLSKSILTSDVKIIQTNKNFKDMVNDLPSLISYDYLSVFYCKNYYASEFITDLMNSFKYSEALIAGKCTHYVYFEDKNLLELRNPKMEYRYVNTLSPEAFICHKQVLDQIVLTEKDEELKTNFLSNWLKAGIRIYSGDRFNFVSVKKDSTKKLSVNIDHIVDFGEDYQKFITV